MAGGPESDSNAPATVGTSPPQPDDITPAGTRIRVLRATVADPVGIARRIAAAPWLADATVLKRDARTSVLAGTLDSLPVVVKCARLDRPKDPLARLFGNTRGMRQWRGAALLASLGFATPEVILLARGRDPRGRVVETLVMERVPGPTLLEAAAGRAPELTGVHQRAGLAHAVGVLVGAMARAALRNRDLKASNIIVQPAPGEHAGFVLLQIDTVAVTSGAPSPGEEMLFRLLVECVGTGHTPRRSERWRTLRTAVEGWGGDDPRAVWHAVARRLARHADPTPKVNPLA